MERSIPSSLLCIQRLGERVIFFFLLLVFSERDLV
jgi:hypothetical protein